ncbi:DNA-directed RNA polymerase subunit H [Candidatus Woesearchaeota archaeon]|nr:DNA-directed RNA polymerase subunit H [Candidatus Woesearchaeota archaeon]
MAFKVSDHVLVPKHTKLGDKEREQVLERYNIRPMDLPKISIDDPAIATLEVKSGDIIKITRKSESAGEAIFFRVVTGG